MKIEIELDPELKVLFKQLISVLRDLTEIVAPLTGHRIVPDEEE